MDKKLRAHIAKESLINFVINVGLNGWLTWSLLGDVPILNAFGEHSYVGDLMGMGTVLPMIIGAIMLLVHQRKVRKGKMESAPGPSGLWANMAGRPNWQVILAFGLFGALLAFSLGLALSVIAGELDPLAFTMIKGLFAGALAVAIVIPFIQLGLCTERVTSRQSP
jgi:hypothetical protein